MKTLRTLALTFILSFLTLTIGFFSCQKDECKGIVCQHGGSCNGGICNCPDGFTGPNCEFDVCDGVVCMNGGTCVNGACECPDGFEGNQCQQMTRMKFIGIWTVTEDGTASAPSQYLVSVITGDEPAEVRIQNMNNKFTSPVIASVRQDSLFIPAQTIDNITIEGKGVLLTGGPNLSIRLFYKVTEAGQTNDYGFDSGNFSIWTR